MPSPRRCTLVVSLGPRELAQATASHAGVTLAELEERSFEDGEDKIRPLVDVAGDDVAVVAGLFAHGGRSVNDMLCRLLFLIGCLRDHGAARVRVIAPYLCYARKDRRTKAFDPVTIRYVAQLIEAVGCDEIVTVDVHNPAAFENAFRIRAHDLSMAAFWADHVVALGVDEPLAVVSPDSGGMKRVEALRLELERRTGLSVGKAFMEKFRSGGQVTGDLFAGEVAGRCAIVLDDLVSTGGSMHRTALECRRRGARRVVCMATHGLFTGGAHELISSDAVDEIVVTDTVPVDQAVVSRAGPRLRIVSVAPLLAATLR
ncbi:ribose-phosphate diphosphokinase [Alsobacter sp. R-9]